MVKNRHSRRDTAVEVASGVDTLIQKLRDEGVNQGRTQAAQIVADAQKQADSTVKQAQQQAEQIVNQARKEAENLKRASNQALEVALRDTVLALKSQLTRRFTGEVQRLVGTETEKPEILEKLILEVVGRVKEEAVQAQQVEVLLPTKIVGFEELRQHPEELEQGILSHFIRLINEDLLREGVNFGIAKDNKGGLQLRLVDRDVVLDLSDAAIADVLLEHLQPRFRALLEGIVK
jgi:V/A-type H+-transporting ATPase subunit E